MATVSWGKDAPRVAPGASPPLPRESRSAVDDPTSPSDLAEKARDPAPPSMLDGRPPSARISRSFNLVAVVVGVGLMARSLPYVAKAYEEERAAFDPREGSPTFHWTPFGGMIAGREYGQGIAIAMVLIQAVLYVMVLGLTWKYRPETPPPALNKWLFAHNVVMSSFSGLIVAACALEMYRSSSPSDRWYCAKVETKAFDVIQAVWVGSKIYEWIDTVFLLLRHKRPIFLHLWHHSTATAIFMLATQHSAASKFFLLFNGFVHIGMYAHYARPFPPVLRRWITRVQILQFTVGGIWFTASASSCYENLDKKMVSIILGYALVGSHLILFLHFFVTDSKRRKVRSMKGKSA
ncbi:hypothetical protein ACHAWF_013969 [Thalassiosira exigua]